MEKVLIIKPSGIGDIVHSLPVAIGLKKIFPNVIIHWLVFSKFADIFYNFNYVDKLILWDRDGGVKEYLRVIKELCKDKYDLVIDLQFLLRTAIIAKLTKADKKVGVSFFREYANLFIKPISKFNPELHAVDRNYEILKKLFDSNLPEPYDYLPWLKVNNKEKEIVNNLLKDIYGKKFILLSVTSRGRHKIWPEEYFSQLINMMCA